MNKFSNVITISGAGRNVGKTYLGEFIISYFSKEHSTIAIKISKFKHKAIDKIGQNQFFETSNFTIWEELNFTTKDSGRYLKAGAEASYYVECDDANLLNAFLAIYDIYGKSCLIICESASITKFINPGISVFVESESSQIDKNKLFYLQRSTIVLREKSIEVAMPQLFLYTQNNNWLVKYSEKVHCDD